MVSVTDQVNLEQYNSADNVETYVQSEGLMPAEEHLFGRHIAPGSDILDIGVGGGRTTPALSALAGRYVGADFAAAMVDACRRRFPEIEFQVADAADLSAFGDGRFDVVVFSFNGVDCLPTDAARHRFLDEAHRVLRPGGRLILSRHNARGVLMIPLRGQRSTLREWAGLVKYGVLENALRARTIPWTPAFRRGEGQIFDRADGGILLRVATRDRAVDEVEQHEFRLLEAVGSNHPLRLPSAITPWWHLAFERR